MGYKDLMQEAGLLHSMAPEKLAQLHGEILSLYMASKRHRNITIDSMAAVTLPAIHFNQFRIYRKAGQAIGWICWAFFSDEDAVGYMAGGFEFKVSSWHSGNNLWFIDVVAPYGHMGYIADDLKTNVFPNRIGYAPYLDTPDGSKRIRKFYGCKMNSSL